MNDFHCYNMQTTIWSPIRSTGKIPSPRYFHASAVYSDSLFLFGGYSGQDRLNDLYEFSFSEEGGRERGRKKGRGRKRGGERERGRGRKRGGGRERGRKKGRGKIDAATSTATAPSLRLCCTHGIVVAVSHSFGFSFFPSQRPMSGRWWRREALPAAEAASSPKPTDSRSSSSVATTARTFSTTSTNFVLVRTYIHTLHDTTLHYTTLHDTTLHDTTLHYMTLHYTT